MLKIFLLGKFSVEACGQLLPVDEWPRRHPKLLLKMLALAPNRQLHRDQLCEALWPDFEPEAARRNLSKAVHFLRHTLEPDLTRPANSQFILLKNDFVQLSSLAEVWIDTAVFEVLALTIESRRSLEEAVALYKGDLLEEDLYEDWLVPRREALRAIFCRLVFRLAEVYRQKTNFEGALALYQRILEKDPTNEAAHRGKMLTFALAGQRAEASRQYQLCHEILETEFGFDPDDETEQLYQQIQAGEFSLPPVLVAEPQLRKSNLPVPTGFLIGRDKELQQICDLLRQNSTRLLTLTGPGGTGKTRLSLEVAHALEAEFADGVHFVTLATLHDPALLLTAISQVLSLEQGSNQTVLGCLKNALRFRQMLLVLDNFEQLVSGAPLVVSLLEAASGLKIIVTSREVLHVSNEVEFALAPLALPNPENLADLTELEQPGAVAFLVNRARQVKPDFRVTLENAAAIAGICLLLDGLPLALELAAARLKLFSPQVLFSRLSTSRLDLLTNGSRNLPPHQQNLRATLDWSYKLLSSDEQVLFRRLAVFSGTFSLEAATTVCGEGAETGNLLDQLVSLVDKSLLQHIEGQDGEPRFGMLETVREYAQEQLCAHPQEAESFISSHLHYYVDLAERGLAQDYVWPADAWSYLFENEIENFRIATSRAHKRGNLLAIARLSSALWNLWRWGGQFSEASYWLEQSLGALDLPPLLRLRTLVVAGQLACLQGRYADAEVFTAETVQLMQVVEDVAALSEAYNTFGNLALHQGDFTTAREMYQQALAAARRSEVRHYQFRPMANLGHVAIGEQNYAEALQHYKDSLKLAQELSDRGALAYAFNGMGEVARCTNDYKQAELWYQQSLVIMRELQDRGKFAMVLLNLGFVWLEQADYECALEKFRQSLQISLEMGQRVYITTCLTGLAGCALPENPRKAAYLLGVIQNLLDSALRLQPTDQLEHAKIFHKTRERLPAIEFEAALQEGQQAALESVLSTVLEKQGRVEETWRKVASL